MEMWNSILGFGERNAALIGLLGLAIGVLGIILAYVFYKNSKPVRLLAVGTRSFPVISKRAESIADLDVRLKGQPASTISLTYLAIWNAGTESLRRQDIPAGEPLMVRAQDGVKILSATLAEATRTTNQVAIGAVNENQASVPVAFEFLNPGDGALIHVVHSGVGKSDLQVVGSLIGGGIRQFFADSDTQVRSAGKGGVYVSAGSRRDEAFTNVITYSLLGLIALLIGVLFKSGVLFFVALFVAIAAFEFWVLRRRYPPLRLKGFDKNI